MSHLEVSYKTVIHLLGRHFLHPLMTTALQDAFYHPDVQLSLVLLVPIQRLPFLIDRLWLERPILPVHDAYFGLHEPNGGASSSSDCIIFKPPSRPDPWTTLGKCSAVPLSCLWTPIHPLFVVPRKDTFPFLAPFLPVKTDAYTKILGHPPSSRRCLSPRKVFLTVETCPLLPWV